MKIWYYDPVLMCLQEKNYHEIVFRYDELLRGLYIEWSDRFEKHPEANGNFIIGGVRATLKKFFLYSSYVCL